MAGGQHCFRPFGASAERWQLKPIFISSPTLIAQAAWRMFFVTGEIWRDIGWSALEYLVGLLLAIVIGIPLGLSQITSSVVIRALARAIPSRVPAPGSAAGGSLSSSGRHPVTGRWYAQYEILNGGTGARPDADGVSAMDELVVNVMNTPVEAIESEFPIRVERYELAQDSAGPGKFRGGLGVRRQWRNLTDETSVNLRMDRFKFSTPGVFGAKPARASKAVLNPGQASERTLTSKVAGLKFKRDELLTVEFAGGGGRGDPFDRDPVRVRDDVVRAYISIHAAHADYGVVLDPESLEIDYQATAAVRQKARA